MKIRKKQTHGIQVIGGIILLTILAACAGAPAKTKPVPPPEERFHADMADLFENLVDKQMYLGSELAPAAVMPGSLKKGSRFSRLEELVMEKLETVLRKQHEMRGVSRQNWFEFREGDPLSLRARPSSGKGVTPELTVYEVIVSANEILNTLEVRIVAWDEDGSPLAGVVAENAFEFGEESPARKLFETTPGRNPYPKGLEENPYTSIDKLTYSLARELANAYGGGFPSAREFEADPGIRVLLYAKPSPGIARGQALAIRNALQQEIINQKGFTCAASREDLGPALDQVEFYQRNRRTFDLEESLFSAGTVLLMAEIFQHPDGKKIGVAARAMWRIPPREASGPGLIPTNVPGAYLSGFTAKAYLAASGMAVHYSPAAKEPEPMTKTTTHSGEQTKTTTLSGNQVKRRLDKEIRPSRATPSRDLEVCFYEFTEVFENRIYPVLGKAPSVDRIRRDDEPCGRTTECLCYELRYNGEVEHLESWLRERLRTSQVLPFKMVRKSENMLKVEFHGGFD